MTLIEEIKVPHESVNDLSVTIMSVLVKEGMFVKKGEPLIEIESSKTTFTLSAEHDGYATILCTQGDDVQVGQTVIKIFDAPPVKKEEKIKIPEDIYIETNQPVKTIFSENALTLMDSFQLTKKDFSGYDFVNADDVKLKAGIVQTTDVFEKKSIREIPATSVKNHAENIKPSKKREIEYLGHVQSAGLNSQVSVMVDLSNIFSHINSKLKYFKNSILPITIYECSRLLHKYPELNSFYSNNQIVYYDEMNVGIALDIDDGLKTVNIRQCDTKTIQTIEEELMILSEKYLAKTLIASELSGITFTITDLSSENILSFTPLINKQNAAILGISSVQQNNLCCFTLSFDHRITVGKDVSRFLNELKLRIESYKSPVADLSNIKCYKCFKKLHEDFSEIGFLKVVNRKGIESYICQTCLKGF